VPVHHAHTPAVARPAGRRWQAWAHAVAVALLVHGVLLGAGFDGSPGRMAQSGVRATPVTVSLQRPTGPAQVPRSDGCAAVPATAPHPVAARAAAARPHTVVAAAPARGAAVETAPLAAPDPADADDTVPPPVYATRLPPPFRWQYELQRGGRSGQSEIMFEAQDGAYLLNWSNRQPGREDNGLSSRGHIDEAGLAPERFADRRRGRERQAANFDRAGGRITYSGPQVEHHLMPGAQDRLSWMVQLSAIVDADPATRALTDARVRVQVTGSRGEAGIWAFVVQGREGLDLPAGTVADAVHLLREPRRPHDTRVEVWLDPARHHLPVRLRLTPVPAGEPLELRLAMESAPGP
jgi:Protein of unknown function (DUF3108)